MRREKVQVRKKGKLRLIVFFRWLAGAEPSGPMRDGELWAIAVRSTFQVKRVKNRRFASLLVQYWLCFFATMELWLQAAVDALVCAQV